MKPIGRENNLLYAMGLRTTALPFFPVYELSAGQVWLEVRNGILIRILQEMGNEVP